MFLLARLSLLEFAVEARQLIVLPDIRLRKQKAF